jgi:biopolymer transport protein ExbB/TolQ
MTYRNKGIFSAPMVVSIVGLLLAIVVVEAIYATIIRPRAEDVIIRQRVMAKENATSTQADRDPSIYVIVKDPEQEVEIIFSIWGMIVLIHKLIEVRRERALFKHDFVRTQPGERIIPEDAFDRYKELKSAVENEPRWHDKLLPDCMLAALHRFQATHSIQDAANAIKERAELAADRLDSSLSLMRYIVWAIPAIGFIGTVRGIGQALSHADEAIKGDISAVTGWLGVAFNSTLVALVLSMALMYVMHLVQSRQEAFIIETQAYCRDRLIDVMKVPAKDSGSNVHA